MQLYRVSRLLRSSYFRNFSQGARPPTVSPAASSPQVIKTDVAGLSSNIVKPAQGPVGPGASPTGDYKVPEYFCYNRMSYHEAEIELAKYRCPQPSAQRK